MTAPLPDPALNDILKRLLVDAGGAPGGSAGAAAKTPAGWRTALGVAGAASREGTEPVSVSSIYDLASVSKPITATAAARLVRSGALRFSTSAGELIEETRGSPVERVTLELLLAHRGGLSAHVELFAPLRAGVAVTPADMLRRAAMSVRAEITERAPDLAGWPPVYSDLGYLIAGEMLVRAAGSSLADIVDREVNRPLGTELYSAGRWHEAGQTGRIVPTEISAFRGGLIHGAVHDDNAFAYSGMGLSGHAGLFATASSTLRFGMAMIDAVHGESEWLEETSAEVLVGPRPGGTLRAGFDGKSREGSAAGQWFGSRSFGHLGFTGTSLWCDPDAQIVVALLTNRVHPTRHNIHIRELRPSLHDALFEYARDDLRV